MSVAFYAGSFDPVTVGHLDLVRRALPLFDEVVVAVGHNPAKSGWFTPEERVAMFRDALGQAAVRFTIFQGLAVVAARAAGATVLLRGLRGPGDMDLELRNATGNRELSGLETLWLPADARHQHVSSSLVREIAGFGGDVSRYVPGPVAEALEQRVKERSSSSR